MTPSKICIAGLLVITFVSVILADETNETNVIDATSFWYTDDAGKAIKAYFNESDMTEPTPADFARAAEKTYFRVYRIGEKGQGRLIWPNCPNCLSETIKGVTTIFFAHGFNSNPFSEIGTSIRSAFSARGQAVNMVFIDWSYLAGGIIYGTAARNVQPVGEYTAQMIDFLISSNVVSLSNIVYAGHSLGAHVGNYVAANLKSGRLPVIHALDPAYPWFSTLGNKKRIDPSDADFVNVIHTAGGDLTEGGLAFFERRGHADFYPNGGRKQPGCTSWDLGVCKHSRAYLYFAESVKSPQVFSGCQCNSWEEYDARKCYCQTKAVMGWATPKWTRGAFYLRTNSQSPFGQS